MNLIQKGIIVISGIPASGKSYFALKLKQKLSSSKYICKIFSTDSLESFLSFSQDKAFQNVRYLCMNKDWDVKLASFNLDKRIFNEKTWKLSRQFTESWMLLNTLFQSCEILIIEDQLPLISQRKPFKKYCSQKNIKFLQIQIKVSLQQALIRNQKRGQIDQRNKVCDQVIIKSLQKFQSSADSLIVNQQNFEKILSEENFIDFLKKVSIQDNYSEYLSKKAIVHQHTQKQIDQNQLRKLITKIINDQNSSQQYFLNNFSKKEKALVLAQCKKIYINSKRVISFKQIVQDFVQKNKQKF